MPDTNIPRGPIHTEPLGAIPTSHGQMSRAANEAALRDALDGLPLGAHDLTILGWLTRWEPSTVATVCSWLYRAREAGSRG